MRKCPEKEEVLVASGNLVFALILELLYALGGRGILRSLGGSSAGVGSPPVVSEGGSCLDPWGGVSSCSTLWQPY